MTIFKQAVTHEIVVCTCSYMCMFVYLQTVRARPIRDVTEAETHQAADVEVTEMHQCK